MSPICEGQENVSSSNTNLSHRDIKLPALTILVVVDKSTEIVGNSHAGVSE